MRRDRSWILLLFLISLLLRFLTNSNYGFHRDEFLYISQGQHPAWGFWSNPPGPAFFSWITQLFFGDSLFAIRFLPGLLGGCTVLMVCLIAKEMGGGRFAQILAGCSVIVSNSMPRVFLLYSPVPFDVFYWTLAAYLIVKYLHAEQHKYLLWLGVVIGAGMLNKYSMIFFVLAAIIALLTTSHRRLFRSRNFYQAVLISLVIISPNLIWQWQYGFPVIGHMELLQETQLVNVRITPFLKDQLLFNSSVLLIWLPGLFYLFLHPDGKKFVAIGTTFVMIIILLVLLRGKSYYTLGAYPMLFAAGAVAWEKWTIPLRWIRAFPILIALAIFGFTLPFSVPYLPLERMVHYGKRMVQYGLDGVVRWEDGLVHDLPQDYADMLGWEEMGDLVIKAVRALPDQTQVFIYCENFGQAGAVAYHGGNAGLPEPASFADAFVLWAPERIDPSISDFIYVNDQMGEDVQHLFNKITVIGAVENQYAREQGTTVWLCQEPRTPFNEFWEDRLQQVTAQLNLPVRSRSQGTD